MTDTRPEDVLRQALERLEQAEGAIERIRMAANGYKDKATQAVYTPASRLAEIRELLDEATAEPTKGERCNCGFGGYHDPANPECATAEPTKGEP